jgi:hypothetical protein
MSAAAWRHRAQCGLAPEDRALQVHGQHAVDLVFRVVGDRPVAGQSGVVDPDVDRAQAPFGLASEVGHRGSTGDVGRYGDRTGLRKVLVGAAECLLVAIAQDHSSAGREQSLGQRTTDAARGSGNDTDPSLEPSWRVSHDSRQLAGG